MTADVLAIALALLAIGALVCFAGYPLFLVAVPLWAFLVGFDAGAGAVATVLGEGFLRSILGLIVGVVLGAVAAAVSYFYVAGAVVVFGATVGFVLALGVASGLGFGSTLGAYALGGAAAVATAILFVRFEMPRTLAIVGTAVLGAASVTASLALITGSAGLDALQDGVAGGTIRGGPAFTALWSILALLGVFAQQRVAPQYEDALRDGLRQGLSGR